MSRGHAMLPLASCFVVQKTRVRRRCDVGHVHSMQLTQATTAKSMSSDVAFLNSTSRQITKTISSRYFIKSHKKQCEQRKLYCQRSRLCQLYCVQQASVLAVIDFRRRASILQTLDNDCSALYDKTRRRSTKKQRRRCFLVDFVTIFTF